jgi:hypothetical protein
MIAQKLGEKSLLAGLQLLKGARLGDSSVPHDHYAVDMFEDGDGVGDEEAGGAATGEQTRGSDDGVEDVATHVSVQGRQQVVQ